MSQRYYYKDFVTAKTRYTRGKFIGWSERTGPLKRRYAGFERGSDTLWIPIYLLLPETRELLLDLEGHGEARWGAVR